jgi:hypothetical protein
MHYRVLVLAENLLQSAPPSETVLHIAYLGLDYPSLFVLLSRSDVLPQLSALTIWLVLRQVS